MATMNAVLPSTGLPESTMDVNMELEKEQAQPQLDSSRTGMTEELSSLMGPSERIQSTSTMATASDTTATDTDLQDEDRSSKRRVNFDAIMIREYDRTLGDNPATTHGPPLTLDWEYEDVASIKVDEYEAQRAPRRITHQMMIPGNARENILLTQTPTTKQQIQNMVSQVRSSRHRRQSTVAMQDFEEWHEAFEFISRRFRRLRKGLSKQREQELLWEQAHEYQKHKEASSLEHKDAVSEDSTDDGCTGSSE